MAFTQVADGDLAVATQLQQVIDALSGISGAGQPIALTTLDDGDEFALSVKNLGTGGLGLKVLSSAGADLLEVRDSYTAIDNGTVKIDHTNNRVGINNTSPAVALDVTGSASVSGSLIVGTSTFGSSITLPAISTPSAPASGTIIYVKSNGKAYRRAASGFEIQLADIGDIVYNVADHGLTAGTSSSLAAANTSALQTLWTTVATAGGGTIYFPPGFWSLNATTLNHALGYSATVNIKGAGGATVLYFHGVTGPFLNIASSSGSNINYGYFRDFQLRHNDVVTSGATLQLGYVSNYLLQNIRSLYNTSDKASLISVRLHASASALKFVDCKFATRADITQLSFDGLTPYGLQVAVSSGGPGFEFHGTEFSGCNAGGAAIADGAVSSVTVSAVGSGYTSAPTVSFSGGGGSGAAGTATISGGKVTGVTITNGGSGYTSAPTVSFSGGGGSGAAATLTGRGTGMLWLNTTLIDTVTFSGLCLIKDWDTGMRFGFGSDNGTVANLIANGLVIDGVYWVDVHYTPSGTAAVANHQFGDCWFSSLGYNFLFDNSGSGSLYGVQINGSYLTGAQTRAIYVVGAISELVINGNRITCDASLAGTVALDIGDGTNAVEDVVITGNRIAVAGASPDAVIRINANVDSFTIDGNALRRGADADGIINLAGTSASKVIGSNSWKA